MLSINDLNDDCLILIFQYLPLSTRLNLPLVCKRFNFISKNYTLNNVQQCLGILTEQNCDYLNHEIKDEDTIYNLSIEQNNSFYFNRKNSLSKFQLSRSTFKRLLINCSRLKVLSLRLVECIDNKIILIILNYCLYLEHLTITLTSIQCDSLLWNEFCNKVCSKLKCLNLEYVDQLTDHLISNIIRKSINLESFAISGNDQQLFGYFFENLSNKIKSITIKKIDLFNNQGTSALMSLISGNGRNIKKLHFKGRLSGNFLNQINLIQKTFKKLEELEIGDSIDDTSSSFQRILGQTLAKIVNLKKISFILPQLTPINYTINSFVTKLIELNYQNNLTSFKLNGGEISDRSIELLCMNCINLNEFNLIHNSYFAKENLSLTNKIYLYLSKLNDLNYLTINGLNLDDQNLKLILNNCKLLKKIDLRNCWQITVNSLIELVLYANQLDHNVSVYLSGTQISLLDLKDNKLIFNYSNSRLKLNFHPAQDNLIEFDIIEDDFAFV